VHPLLQWPWRYGVVVRRPLGSGAAGSGSGSGGAGGAAEREGAYKALAVGGPHLAGPRPEPRSPAAARADVSYTRGVRAALFHGARTCTSPRAFIR
jgi:hypothetical protein